MNPRTPLVLIVLPVYNGARYLARQLDSILGQTLGNVRILYRDDGSEDDSPKILAEYATRHPGKFYRVEGPAGNLGVRASFSLLLTEALEQSHEESKRALTYIALADQDDFWYPHKLERLVTHIQEVERVQPGLPAAVHSDLRLVDVEGSELAPSLVRYQGLQPLRQRFAARLFINTMTGCSMLMNRQLLALALPIPAEAAMHDWWLALVATAFGRTDFIDEPLLDYRQHATNTLGARARSGFTLEEILHRVRSREERRFYNEVLCQAEVLSQRYGLRLNYSKRLLIRMAALLRSRSFAVRRCAYHALRRL